MYQKIRGKQNGNKIRIEHVTIKKKNNNKYYKQQQLCVKQISQTDKMLIIYYKTLTLSSAINCKRNTINYTHVYNSSSMHGKKPSLCPVLFFSVHGKGNFQCQITRQNT